MNLLLELKKRLADPSRATDDPAILAQHGSDATSYHSAALPAAVVYATSKQEVSELLSFAHEQRIAVVPYGAGSSVEGQVVPPQGGICLDLTLMNQIVEVYPDDLIARVQPGVTKEQLQRHLQPYGMYFPVDLGANATLGGMAATNAGGIGALRYGSMKDNVLGLEVVMADGKTVKTGGLTRKLSAGYPLASLFIGSEGTLGVMTELTLRLTMIPPYRHAVRASFPDLEAACRAAVHLMKEGFAVAKFELMDPHTLRCINAYKGTNYAEQPTLFLEFSGRRQHVEADMAEAVPLLRQYGASQLEDSDQPEHIETLWSARTSAAYAILAMNPGKKLMTTDVCVPLSKLPSVMRHARHTIQSRNMNAALLGHVGDGNYHAVLAIDPASSEEAALANEVNEQLVAFALENGGTCSGEHGIGLGKRHYLLQQYGDQTIALMQAVKDTFDPHHILNPGKVLPT